MPLHSSTKKAVARKAGSSNKSAAAKSRGATDTDNSIDAIANLASKMNNLGVKDFVSFQNQYIFPCMIKKLPILEGSKLSSSTFILSPSLGKILFLQSNRGWHDIFPVCHPAQCISGHAEAELQVRSPGQQKCPYLLPLGSPRRHEKTLKLIENEKARFSRAAEKLEQKQAFWKKCPTKYSFVLQGVM